MYELRTIFPTQVVRGALLRPDGIAVGLVSGGAPSWELLSQAMRGQAGDDYHRLLLALDAPLDVYLVDQPPDVAGAITLLLERQQQASQRPDSSPLLAAVLNEIADYLTDLGQQSGSRAKQIIWAVTGGGNTSARGVGGLDLRNLIRRRANSRAGSSGQGQIRIAPAALTQAVEQARRLADALGMLGGTPAPRLLEAEEIARLVYGLADPVRAQRYPLAGTLLDRVRRVAAQMTHVSGKRS
jgi:hypothetical protein